MNTMGEQSAVLSVKVMDVKLGTMVMNVNLTVCAPRRVRSI
jgi:hypothetical protein